MKNLITIIIISLFVCESVTAKCDISGGSELCDSPDNHAPAKCNVANGMAFCDSLGVPVQVYQSVSSLTIKKGYNVTYLPQYLFRYSNFKGLTISMGKIKTLRENTFVDLVTTYLGLSYNGIETILPGAFKNLSKLNNLSLMQNKLKQIQAGIFTKLPLSSLTLSHNSIETFEDLALTDLPNLKKLRLDNNKIKNIFLPKILDDPSTLEILWLHNNSLKTLTNYMLMGLVKLSILNVGFNKIETFEEGTFEQTPKLQTLVLTNNKIKEIDGSVFPRGGLPSLEKIYLDNNELMYLPSSFFFRLNYLKSMTLVGNPWLCPCLDVISRTLFENQIKEKCQNEFRNGEKPVCISEPTDNKCSYKYNSELSAKYLEVKNSVVVKGRQPLCIL